MQNKLNVVALGELLWDLLPDGAKFGGAPGNFAHHAARLGANVSMVSGVGDDSLGRDALRRMRTSGLDVAQVLVSTDYPTGAVNVSIDADGIASYDFNDDDAWDHLQWTDDLQQLAVRCDAACFGTLGQRNAASRQTIQRFLRATPESSLRVFDVNLRSPFYSDVVIEQSLKLANVLKLNDEELPYLGKLFGISGSLIDQVSQLAQRYDLRLVAVTRGEQGALLVGAPRAGGPQVSEAPAQPTTVRDTVGAGDAFTAAITVGMLCDMELAAMNQAACRIAEYVCTQPGATPQLPEDLRRAFTHFAT